MILQTAVVIYCLQGSYVMLEEQGIQTCR